MTLVPLCGLQSPTDLCGMTGLVLQLGRQGLAALTVQPQPRPASPERRRHAAAHLMTAEQ